MKDKINMFIILVIVILVVAIYLTINEIRKQECYNMPINQYVEDKSCTKFTWEQYMEEHYGK